MCAIATVACGGGGGKQSPTAPGDITTPPPAATPPAALTALNMVATDSFIHGQNMGGQVTLSAAAPAAGIVVAIASSNPTIADVPASVTVPAGKTSTLVPVMTHAVVTETPITLTASAGGLIVSGNLTIPPGPYFAFASPGEIIGNGQSRRYTDADSGFAQRVDPSLQFVSVTVQPRGASSSAPEWNLSFSARTGEELRVGTYDGATLTATASAPGMQLRRQGAACGELSASFVIKDILFGPGPSLDRIYATFTQACRGQAALSGEIKLD
jgi:hypothetical protein